MRKISVLLLTLCFFATGCQSKEESVPVNGGSELRAESSFNVEAAVHEDHTKVKLLLHNQGNQPLLLTFPSSQQFEVIIQRASGEELYRYSKGKMFSQALTRVELQPGETKTWEATWNYDENPYQKGETYTITGKLLPIEVNGKKAPANLFTETISYEADGRIDSAEETLDVEVEKQGSGGTYTLSGEAVPSVGQAYYAVSDGHNMLVEETAFDISKPWKISIKIPKEQLPENGTVILEMYAKKKNSKTVVRKLVVLEQFGHVSSSSKR